MFSVEFSLVFGTILAILTVLFFLGKGKVVMDPFDGNRNQRKKRNKEEERRFQRAIGIFCLILTINEFLMAAVGYTYPAYNIIGIIIVVADFIFVAVYLKKNFPD